MWGRVRHKFKKRESETNNKVTDLDLKAGNPNKDIYRKIMRGRIAMTLDQVTAHHTFFWIQPWIWSHIQIGKRDSHLLNETYRVTDSNCPVPKEKSQRWLPKSDDSRTPKRAGVLKWENWWQTTARHGKSQQL